MRRFYREVTLAPEGTGWRVMLDGRAIQTPAGAPQVLPNKALAEALAAEWAGQGEDIDTSAFPLRDLADYALDAVAPAREALVQELCAFAETDTLCYRGEPGEPLHDRQLEVWEPLLVEAERRWDVHFERVGGVVHRPQPAETMARMEAALAARDDFTLAALRMLASLSASLVIALAAVKPGADAEALWAAANLEEDWQAELWGRDAAAEARRRLRFEAFRLAMRFAALAREP